MERSRQSQHFTRRRLVGLVGAGTSAMLAGVGPHFGRLPVASAAARRQADGEPRPGGTLRVAAKGDFTVFDPAFSDDYQSWTMAFQIFDGLYYFDADGNLVPDLAEDLPQISEDGLTYTITLRQGVTFHNGREVEAADFKYSWERILAPETKAFGAGFLAPVVGANAMREENATELEGLRIPDKYTLELHLSEVSASFLYGLGTSYLMVVPREDVERLGEDFGRQPVGTGAYRLTEWSSGQLGVFERNPAYFKAPKPYIDRIEYHLGIDEQLGLLRLESGEVDFLVDGVPLAEFAQIVSDPKWEAYLTESPQYAFGYVALNETFEPFTDQRVRTAVGLALDRARYIQILQGSATEANGLIPPNVPGARSERSPLGYNSEQAMALLSEAGLADGFETEFVYRGEEPPWNNLAPAVQADLENVGITLSLRPLATATYYAEIGSEQGVPMSFGLNGANTPDILEWSLGSNCANPTGVTRTCLPDVEALIGEARALPNEPDTRYGLMAEAEDLALANGHMHPLFNPQLWAMHTPALKNFRPNPITRWWWQDYWLNR